jgi:hypothetical protein
MASNAREERLGRNESIFREVNERIEDAATKLSPMFTEFMCECADETCLEYVSLTLVEYGSIRERGPVYFVVRPGHRNDEIEHVVDGEADRYDVVMKVGEAAEVAIELDPRPE